MTVKLSSHTMHQNGKAVQRASQAVHSRANMVLTGSTLARLWIGTARAFLPGLMSIRLSPWFALAVVLVTLPPATKADHLYIGVRVPLTEHAKPLFRSITPYLNASITKSHPTVINRFRPFEAHHLYLGLGVLGVGCVAHSRLLRVIGGVLVIDDTIQHALRVNSPVHMLNDELYRYRWYRSLQF